MYKRFYHFLNDLPEAVPFASEPVAGERWDKHFGRRSLAGDCER
jgi:hypothetical protein